MTAGHLQLIALLALAVAPVAARAAPLDADTCAKLQVEQAQLEEAGVAKDMAKGAAWARDNLGLEKLQRVQRFIEIEEQLLFRCKSKTIVFLPPETEAGTTASQDGKDDDENKEAKAGTPGKGQPGAKSAPKKPSSAAASRQPASKPPANKPPANKAAARAAAREPTEAGITSITKQPPKAKVDDAYKPPPPDPTINPFATQLVPAED